MDRGADLKRAVDELFGESAAHALLAELPGVESEWAAALVAVGVVSIEDFMALSKEALAAVKGISAEAADKIQAIVDENVEVVEDRSDVPIEASPNPPMSTSAPTAGRQ